MPARERNSCRSSVMATVHMEAVDLDVEFPTGIEQRVEEVLAGRAFARQQVRALRTIGRAHVVTDDIGRQVGDPRYGKRSRWESPRRKDRQHTPWQERHEPSCRSAASTLG